MDNQNRDQNVGGGQQGGKDSKDQPERSRDWNQGGSQQPGSSKPSQGQNPSQGSQGGGDDLDRGGSEGQGSGSGPNR